MKQPARMGIRWFGTLAILLLTVWPISAMPADNAYTLGVFPYFTPTRLEEIYAPVAADLSIKLGTPVAFRTAISFENYFAKLQAQAYDIALFPPLFYIPAVDQFGYLPLARMQEPFTALIVVPDTSPIHDEQALRNKVIASPPNYLPVTLMAKKTLRDHGLLPGRDVRFMETKNTEVCFQRIMTGAADACVTLPFAVIAYQNNTGVRLRIIQETVHLPNILFVVHNRVPVADRERLHAAIIGWSATAEGQAMLQKMNTGGFINATDTDYQPVREFVKELTEPWLPIVP